MANEISTKQIITSFDFDRMYLGYVLDNEDFESNNILKIFIPELFGYSFDKVSNKFIIQESIDKNKILNFSNINLQEKIENHNYLECTPMLNKGDINGHLTKDDYISYYKCKKREKVLVGFLNGDPKLPYYLNYRILQEDENVYDSLPDKKDPEVIQGEGGETLKNVIITDMDLYTNSNYDIDYSDLDHIKVITETPYNEFSNDSIQFENFKNGINFVGSNNFIIQNISKDEDRSNGITKLSMSFRIKNFITKEFYDKYFSNPNIKYIEDIIPECFQDKIILDRFKLGRNNDSNIIGDKYRSRLRVENTNNQNSFNYNVRNTPSQGNGYIKEDVITSENSNVIKTTSSSTLLRSNIFHNRDNQYIYTEFGNYSTGPSINTNEYPDVNIEESSSGIGDSDFIIVNDESNNKSILIFLQAERYFYRPKYKNNNYEGKCYLDYEYQDIGATRIFRLGGFESTITENNNDTDNDNILTTKIVLNDEELIPDEEGKVYINISDNEDNERTKIILNGRELIPDVDNKVYISTYIPSVVSDTRIIFNNQELIPDSEGKVYINVNQGNDYTVVLNGQPVYPDTNNELRLDVITTEDVNNEINTNVENYYNNTIKPYIDNKKTITNVKLVINDLEDTEAEEYETNENGIIYVERYIPTEDDIEDISTDIVEDYYNDTIKPYIDENSGSDLIVVVNNEELIPDENDKVYITVPTNEDISSISTSISTNVATEVANNIAKDQAKTEVRTYYYDIIQPYINETRTTVVLNGVELIADNNYKVYIDVPTEDSYYDIIQDELDNYFNNTIKSYIASKGHEHNNKSILDKINEGDINYWNNKMNKNMGLQNYGKFLAVDMEGNITCADITQALTENIDVNNNFVTQSKFSGLQGDVNTANSELAGLKERVARNTERLDTLVLQLDYDNIPVSETEFHNTIDDMDYKFTTDIDNITYDLDTLKVRVNNNTDSISTINTTLTDHNTKINKNISDIAEIKSTIQTINDPSAIIAQINTLDTKVNNNNNAVNNRIDSTNNSLSTNVTRLDERIDDISSQVDAILTSNVTEAEKTRYESAYDIAQSVKHLKNVPATAEENQNAFSNVGILNTDNNYTNTDIYRSSSKTDSIYVKGGNNINISQETDNNGKKILRFDATTSTDVKDQVRVTGYATSNYTSLKVPDNSDNRNVDIEITGINPNGLSASVPVEKGGTGATTGEGAIYNLGIYSSLADLNNTSGSTGNFQEQIDALRSLINELEVTPTTPGGLSISNNFTNDAMSSESFIQDFFKLSCLDYIRGNILQSYPNPTEYISWNELVISDYYNNKFISNILLLQKKMPNMKGIVDYFDQDHITPTAWVNAVGRYNMSFLFSNSSNTMQMAYDNSLMTGAYNQPEYTFLKTSTTNKLGVYWVKTIYVVAKMYKNSLSVNNWECIFGLNNYISEVSGNRLGIYNVARNINNNIYEKLWFHINTNIYKDENNNVTPNINLLNNAKIDTINDTDEYNDTAIIDSNYHIFVLRIGMNSEIDVFIDDVKVLSLDPKSQGYSIYDGFRFHNLALNSFSYHYIDSISGNNNVNKRPVFYKFVALADAYHTDQEISENCEYLYINYVSGSTNEYNSIYSNKILSLAEDLNIMTIPRGFVDYYDLEDFIGNNWINKLNDENNKISFYHNSASGFNSIPFRSNADNALLINGPNGSNAVLQTNCTTTDRSLFKFKSIYLVFRIEEILTATSDTYNRQILLINERDYNRNYGNDSDWKHPRIEFYLGVKSDNLNKFGLSISNGNEDGGTVSTFNSNITNDNHYHVLTVTYEEYTVKFYFDGTLIYTFQRNNYNFSRVAYIGLGCYPYSYQQGCRYYQSANKAQKIYIKHLSVAETTHDDNEVLLNYRYLYDKYIRGINYLSLTNHDNLTYQSIYNELVSNNECMPEMRGMIHYFDYDSNIDSTNGWIDKLNSDVILKSRYSYNGYNNITEFNNNIDIGNNCINLLSGYYMSFKLKTSPDINNILNKTIYIMFTVDDNNNTSVYKNIFFLSNKGTNNSIALFRPYNLNRNELVINKNADTTINCNNNDDEFIIITLTLEQIDNTNNKLILYRNGTKIAEYNNELKVNSCVNNLFSVCSIGENLTQDQLYRLSDRTRSDNRTISIKHFSIAESCHTPEEISSNVSYLLNRHTTRVWIYNSTYKTVYNTLLSQNKVMPNINGIVDYYDSDYINNKGWMNLTNNNYINKSTNRFYFPVGNDRSFYINNSDTLYFTANTINNSFYYGMKVVYIVAKHPVNSGTFLFTSICTNANGAAMGIRNNPNLGYYTEQWGSSTFSINITNNFDNNWGNRYHVFVFVKKSKSVELYIDGRIVNNEEIYTYGSGTINQNYSELQYKYFALNSCCSWDGPSANTNWNYISNSDNIYYKFFAIAEGRYTKQEILENSTYLYNKFIVNQDINTYTYNRIYYDICESLLNNNSCMPVMKGMINYFDIDHLSSSGWLDILNNNYMTINNTTNDLTELNIQEDGSLLLGGNTSPNNNYAIINAGVSHQSNLYRKKTIYIVAKIPYMETGSKTPYVIGSSCCSSSSSNAGGTLSLAIIPNSRLLYCDSMYSNNFISHNNITDGVYHVYIIQLNNNNRKFYIDNNLIADETDSYNYPSSVFKYFGLCCLSSYNAESVNGQTITDQLVYYKHVAIAEDSHTENEILRNIYYLKNKYNLNFEMEEPEIEAYSNE